MLAGARRHGGARGILALAVAAGPGAAPAGFRFTFGAIGTASKGIAPRRPLKAKTHSSVFCPQLGQTCGLSCKRPPEPLLTARLPWGFRANPRARSCCDGPSCKSQEGRRVGGTSRAV